jgi:putative phage-type endonuclease
MEQRSDEWFAARLGRVTASRVADIIAQTKSGYSSSREKYMGELLCERLTGKRTVLFMTTAMSWGTDTEPMAALAYEAKTGNLVEGVGFVPHPTIEAAGASPDGLVDHDGLIEIKCPIESTHTSTLMSKTVPSKYIPQIQWQMASVSPNVKWVDFISYNPNFPDDLQLFVTRVERNDEYIDSLEVEVKQFLEEVETTILKLKE